MEIELQTRIQREQIMRFKRDFHECPPTEIERQNRIHQEQLDMLKQTFFQRTRRRVQRPITTDKPMDKWIMVITMKKAYLTPPAPDSESIQQSVIVLEAISMYLLFVDSYFQTLHL